MKPDPSPAEFVWNPFLEITLTSTERAGGKDPAVIFEFKGENGESVNIVYFGSKSARSITGLIMLAESARGWVNGEEITDSVEKPSYLIAPDDISSLFRDDID